MGAPSQERVVVVAADEGPHSMEAFKHSLRRFPLEVTHYHIVNVRPDHTKDMGEEVYSLALRSRLSETEKMQKQKAHSVLRAFCKEAVAVGAKHDEEMLEGDPRMELCKFCEEKNADTLVVGSRGTSKISRLLLGSVSSYCVHHAPCAVFVHKSGL